MKLITEDGQELVFQTLRRLVILPGCQACQACFREPVRSRRPSLWRRYQHICTQRNNRTLPEGGRHVPAWCPLEVVFVTERTEVPIRGTEFRAQASQVSITQDMAPFRGESAGTIKTALGPRLASVLNPADPPGDAV